MSGRPIIDGIDRQCKGRQDEVMAEKQCLARYVLRSACHHSCTAPHAQILAMSNAEGFV